MQNVTQCAQASPRLQRRLPSLAPLALGREPIPPRTQRLSERLLFRLSESPPAPAAAPPQAPPGRLGMRATSEAPASMRPAYNTAQVPPTILGAWAALNDPLNQQRHHQQSLVRSLVPAIPATPAQQPPPQAPVGGEWRSPQVLLEQAQGTAARAESVASAMEVERDAAHQELVRGCVCVYTCVRVCLCLSVCLSLSLSISLSLYTHTNIYMYV